MGALGAAQAQEAVGVNCEARDARLAHQGRLPASRIGLTRDRPSLDDVDRIDFLFPRAFAGGQPYDRQSVRRRDYLGDLFALAQRLRGLAYSPKLARSFGYILQSEIVSS